MLTVLPISHKETDSIFGLLDWIQELDRSLKQHQALLLGSRTIQDNHLKKVVARAQEVFGQCYGIRQRDEDERGWPWSCNSMFRTAHSWVKSQWHKPFWWNEVDCIPLRSNWLDLLEAEYYREGKPFMGCISKEPFEHLTGCALYPPNIEAYNPKLLLAQETAWDVIEPHMTIKHTYHTKLLHHEWGNSTNNISPSFPNQRSLGLLRKDAVIFHRNKDGTLIKRLRERRQRPFLSKLKERFDKDLGNGFQSFTEYDRSGTKPKISNVTLCAVDGRADCRKTLVSLVRAGNLTEFEACILISPRKPETLPKWIEHRQCAEMDLSGYNRFCLLHLHEYVRTSHCLTIQADSGINNRLAWDDEWLNYDYIGAPWPPNWGWGESKAKCYRTANSGFCLRSQALLRATASFQTEYVMWHGERVERCVDDVATCVNHREELEQQGIKFPPVEIAAKFAWEQPTPEAPKLAGQFGFHLLRA